MDAAQLVFFSVATGALYMVIRTSKQRAKVETEAQSAFSVRPAQGPEVMAPTDSEEPRSYAPSEPPPSQSSHNSTKETLCCPKCWSTQLTADRKGYGWVKGLTIGAFTGGLGLLGGFHGSRKVLITCLKCGHQWKAGSAN